MKKGDLSINLIIVAAIAMIVLLVMVLIFTGRIGSFRQKSERCEVLGGRCVANPTECIGLYDEINPTGTCPGDDGEVGTRDDGTCCVSS